MVSRLGEKRLNNQGCLMKIIEYNGYGDIIVEFQDEYKAKKHTTYHNFKNREVRNPYYKSVYGVGMLGTKYPSVINNKHSKEYNTWNRILQRCYSQKYKQLHPTYKEAVCCKEWLLYDNFYEWLHSQPNFDKWMNGDKWNVDKDILFKRNKIYSPKTCCLVPLNVNNLFVKRDLERGEYPIGVTKRKTEYVAQCNNPFKNNAEEYLGSYSTPLQAFQSYKKYKEDIIKQVAKIEYKDGNITSECYKAMISYKVEVDD